MICLETHDTRLSVHHKTSIHLTGMAVIEKTQQAGINCFGRLYCLFLLDLHCRLEAFPVIHN